MKKVRVANGIYWVEAPEAGLSILCGCPADSVKHLIRKGFIVAEEKNGVLCETGPNVILLSDVPLQNQRFANLAEFPVLQMLYRQGMIVPNHPNNTGVKPMLVGTADQIESQMAYIYRGNYGLISMEELTAAGVDEPRAREMLRLKRRFAFDRIRPTEELLDAKVVGDGEAELRNGVKIRRKEVNVYEISLEGDSVTVDLNLKPGEDYEASYDLGFQTVRRDYFSIIHSGDGDGWDATRPCMSSIITFQGRIYLVDAGPNLLHTLTALGISVNEIEGVFQTHAHDDHFNGLTILLRAERRIKYYATPLVRASVAKKLAALVSLRDGDFSRYFDVHDLREGEWNNIGGLEVMPAASPHPVETSVLFFRALWEEGYRTYAHLADIISLKVLKGMVTEDATKSGTSGARFEEVKKLYATPVDLKKADIGGGMIHGTADDFRNDASGKIILSHTALPLTGSQKEIGSSASFGAVDVLISGERDYSLASAFRYLSAYFPDIPEHELHMILSCPRVMFNPGTIIIRKGEENRHLYLVLSGVLEYLSEEQKIHARLAAGSMAGELSGVVGSASRGTYRATSFVSALRVSRFLYTGFLSRNGILEVTKRNIAVRWFLQNTWLLGEQISCPLKNRLASAMQRRRFSRGAYLVPDGADKKPPVFIIAKGKVALLAGERVTETLKPGNFFGAELVLHGKITALRARALEETETYVVSSSVFEEIPVVQWKIRETYERRIRIARDTAVNGGRS